MIRHSMGFDTAGLKPYDLSPVTYTYTCLQSLNFQLIYYAFCPIFAFFALAAFPFILKKMIKKYKIGISLYHYLCGKNCEHYNQIMASLTEIFKGNSFMPRTVIDLAAATGAIHDTHTVMP